VGRSNRASRLLAAYIRGPFAAGFVMGFDRLGQFPSGLDDFWLVWCFGLGWHRTAVKAGPQNVQIIGF
jgi:hypothetical protein